MINIQLLHISIPSFSDIDKEDCDMAKKQFRYAAFIMLILSQERSQVIRADVQD